MNIIRKSMALFAILLVSIMLISSCTASYETVRDKLLFDHIEYNGTAYYLMDVDLDVPDEFIPFSEETVSVVIVNEEGEPYDESRTEEAQLYINDTDMTYIHFYSAVYTKDKELASKHYNLD